jgi:NADPH:quinone reductase-like Zn-dependent oxidoreductase/malonyl CoA-acyl carrier protein transacylase
MLAVGCGKAEIDPLLQQLNHKVAKIACYNSPQSLTISGDTPAVVELSQVLEEKQIFNRRLVIETAYHSHHMELIAGDYLTSIQHLSAPGKASARFFSSLSGKEACYSELDASYWVRNLTSPVKFAQACANLVAPSGEFATGVDMIVEIGPHAALQGPVKQILKSAGGAIEKIPYAGTLARKKDAVDTIFDLASTVFCKGCPLDLGKVNFPKKVKTPSLLVDLPRYPWNHSRAYWHESRIAKVHKQRKEPRHDLLGALANYSNDLEPTWRNILRLDDVPWLRQHRIQDLTIFPIAAFVAMVLEAAAQLARSKDIEVDNFVLQDVDVHAPLMVPDDSVEVTVTLRSGSGEHRLNQTCRNFLIHSYSENKGWTLNCTGRVAVKATSLNEVGELMQSEKETAPTVRETAEFSDALPELAQTTVYEALEGLGVVYGPAFQGLHLCRADDRRAMADIIVNETAADMPEHFETNHIVHPSLLEQLVQMYWPLLGAGRAPLDVACLPNSIGRLTVSAKVVEHARNPGQKLRSFSKTEKPLSTDKPSTVSMYALAEGKPMIAIEDLTIAPLPAMESGEETPPPRELCYKQIWEPILTPLQGHGDTKVDSPQTEVADNSSTLPATTPITVVHETSPEQVKFAHTVSALLGRHGLLDVQLGVLEDIDPLDRNIICVTELHQSLLSTLTAPQFQKLQTITQSSQSLLWVTRGAYGQTGDPTANMVSGFSRAIRSENMFKFATLDLDAEHRLDDADAVKAILKVFRTVAAANSVVNTEMEFQERKGEFWTPRIVNDDTVNAYVHRRTFPPTTEESEFGADDRALKMSMSKPGLLESFYFIDDEVRDQPLPADQIEIRVGATVVGVRDVEAALGHVDTEDFGNSCSGVVTRVGSEVKRFAVGDRVAAFTQGGSFATYARATEDFALKLQGDISLENAASLPSAYCSAYHALVDLARLEDEDNVLILNAGGCVGQAAIILAQSIGTTVFATVETVADKKLLQRLKVPEEHIFYTNSDPLSKSVMSQTGPKGINVIFSIQADESGCQAALRCLSDFGRFVRDNTKGHSKTGLSCSTGNAAFYSFDLYTLAKSKPRVLGRMMREISRSLKHRILRPVEPSRILSLSDVSQAYKLTRSDPSCGTIVVVPHPEDVVRKTPSTKVVELFKSDATYVLIGGTGGLGRGMTRWMASKGARHIVLLSRRGAVTGPVKRLVDDLTPLGVNIFVHSCDVVKREDVDRLLQSDLVGLPPIKGVIHGAMTLRVCQSSSFLTTTLVC